jgi:hypothetical protein
MEGFEFFPDGFARVYPQPGDLSYVRMVYYEDFKSFKVEKYNEQYYQLTIGMMEADDAYEKNEDLSKLQKYRDEIFARFLEYKRQPKKKKAAALEQLAGSHAALAGYAARFLDEVQLVPGVAGGESEAAVERCKKRARGEEAEE